MRSGDAIPNSGILESGAAIPEYGFFLEGFFPGAKGVQLERVTLRPVSSIQEIPDAQLHSKKVRTLRTPSERNSKQSGQDNRMTGYELNLATSCKSRYPVCFYLVFSLARRILTKG